MACKVEGGEAGCLSERRSYGKSQHKEVWDVTLEHHSGVIMVERRGVCAFQMDAGREVNRAMGF